jgi:peptidoglycan-associated lipoprotein
MTRAMILGLAAAAALSACGGKQEPELPAPEPAPTTAPTTPPPAPTTDPGAADRERERARREAEERAKAVATDLGAMIHFDYDRSDIRAEDAPNLDRKAAILEANPAVRVRISGHADERGSDEYNLALGTRRAASAKRYLENKGVDGSRLEVISYGEERPLSAGADETAWANNRRDEFEITTGGGSLVAPQ